MCSTIACALSALGGAYWPPEASWPKAWPSSWLSIDGETVFWKIDYYDQSLTAAAVDPSSETGCVRVLTVMLAEEY